MKKYTITLKTSIGFYTATFYDRDIYLKTLAKLNKYIDLKIKLA